MPDRTSTVNSLKSSSLLCCLTLLVAVIVMFSIEDLPIDAGQAESISAGIDAKFPREKWLEVVRHERKDFRDHEGNHLAYMLIGPTDRKVQKMVDEFPALQYVNLNRNDYTKPHESVISPAGLKQLERLTQLKSLTLHHGMLLDSEVEVVSGLTGLEELDFAPIRLNPTSIDLLARLTSLKSLVLSSNGSGRPPCPPACDAVTAELLSRFPQLEQLTLSGHGFGKLTVQQMCRLTNLTSLTLWGTMNISADQLADVRNLKRLCKVELSIHFSTDVNDAWLANFGSVKTLKKISITGNHSDRGTRYLTGLTELQLFKSRSQILTDDSFRSLGTLTKLQHLDLESGNITGNGFQSLKRLTQLRQLSFESPEMKTGYFADLRQLPRLETLNVGVIQQTENDNRWKSLAVLKSMKQLKKLSVYLDVDHGIKLQSMLPGCFVDAYTID